MVADLGWVDFGFGHSTGGAYLAKSDSAKPYFDKPYSAKQESGYTPFRNLPNLYSAKPYSDKSTILKRGIY